MPRAKGEFQGRTNTARRPSFLRVSFKPLGGRCPSDYCITKRLADFPSPELLCSCREAGSIPLECRRRYRGDLGEHAGM